MMNALRDWFATDADVEIVEVSDVGRRVGVHDGFHRALMAVAGEIESEVRGSVGDGCPLWITGHSMGGALATLAAPWLRERDIEMTGLCTFGAPMAGDARLARLFRDRPIPSLHRYVREGDPVPALPPRGLGYQHVCAPHVIREDGLLVLDDAAYEPSFDATRHPPRVYCEALHRALPDRQKRLVPAPPEAQ
jgi:predicted lipase